MRGPAHAAGAPIHRATSAAGALRSGRAGEIIRAGLAAERPEPGGRSPMSIRPINPAAGEASETFREAPGGAIEPALARGATSAWVA